MFTNFLSGARSYYAFYGQYFASQWMHMTPWKYGVILISVGIFGWILMKSANKRA